LLLGYEVGAEQNQGDPGDMFRALAPTLPDPGADRQAELSGNEGLEGDSHDNRDDGQVTKADAESDGQLIEADA
jgi:hypothetical protein